MRNAKHKMMKMLKRTQTDGTCNAKADAPSASRMAQYENEISRLKTEVEEAYATVQHTMNRLQEESQKLKTANEELKKAKAIEEKNRELIIINKVLRDENERRQKTRLKGPSQEESEPLLSDLSHLYSELLNAYMKDNEEKSTRLVDELCQGFLAATLPPTKIIELHVRSIRRFSDDISDLATKRKVFSARGVLLMLMTRYAFLLRKRFVGEER
jgi:chromosome segregation ATPase